MSVSLIVNIIGPVIANFSTCTQSSGAAALLVTSMALFTSAVVHESMVSNDKPDLSNGFSPSCVVHVRAASKALNPLPMLLLVFGVLLVVMIVKRFLFQFSSSMMYRLKMSALIFLSHFQLRALARGRSCF
jgi:hypothetical protein